jgi:hypothetical protein
LSGASRKFSEYRWYELPKVSAEKGITIQEAAMALLQVHANNTDHLPVPNFLVKSDETNNEVTTY